MFEYLLLTVLLGIVLVLVGFFVMFIWGIYQSIRERESTSVEEFFKREEEEKERKSRRENIGVIFIGPVPIIVRSERIFLVLSCLVFAIFLLFLVLMFIWLLKFVP